MTSPAGIGHNGAPADLDTDDIKMSWIKLDIADFKRGIANLDYEMRGYYITLLVEMYDSKGRLPNDLYLLGKRLGTTARVIRRVLDVLVAQGKVYVSGEWLRNKRCDEEREKLIAEYCRRHAAAVKRETTKRGNADAIQKVSPKFAGSLPEVSAELSPNFGTLEESFAETIPNSPINSINPVPEPTHTSDHNCAHNLEKKKKEEEKKERKEESFSSDAARATEPGKGREFWTKVMAPPTPPEHQKVTMTDGKLELFNGFKADWLARFGGDEERLELALTTAAGYVQPFGYKPLDVQVSAQLARVVAEKRDRDTRYANAAAAKAKPTAKPKTPSRWGQ